MCIRFPVSIPSVTKNVVRRQFAGRGQIRVGNDAVRGLGDRHLGRGRVHPFPVAIPLRAQGVYRFEIPPAAKTHVYIDISRRQTQRREVGAMAVQNVNSVKPVMGQTKLTVNFS